MKSPIFQSKPVVNCMYVKVGEETWTNILTWTVLHRGEGFADVDIKAA